MVVLVLEKEWYWTESSGDSKFPLCVIPPDEEEDEEKDEEGAPHILCKHRINNTSVEARSREGNICVIRLY